MKQINSLIVIEVPKEGTDHRLHKMPDGLECLVATITDENGNKGKMWFNELSDLPPGQYEIIGLYSEVERNISLQDVACVAIASDHLFETLWQNELIPTNTTDLLFIHKLK